ncbi:MAG: hypothetical protein MUC36_08640 [Planctomycetes bacterium]|jgi:uncharacterized membrane protein|nr:hypothetical protein [Planctomycetota bacterium]
MPSIALLAVPTLRRAALCGALLTLSPLGLSAQQAQFVAIPGRSAVPGTTGSFCGFSGSAGYSGVRVSADGQVVATVVYSPGAAGGAVPRQPARWTAATGTVVLGPDLDGNYGITGISANGNTIYGEDWRWRAGIGYQSLLSQLTPGQTQTRILFDCAYDGLVVTGVQGIFPDLGDLLRWSIDSAPPQVLPRAANFPDGYFYFSTVSGDGVVVGGSTRRPGGSGTSDSYAGVLVTPAGATVVTSESPQAGVTDLSVDGSIAVGFEQIASTVRAFRWTAATGAVYLDANSVASNGGSYARATSIDGEVVVGDYVIFGQAGTRAFVWNATDGLVDLQTALVNDFGLGNELAGWQLLTATDISADGLTIVGQGIAPSGCEQAFLVRLPRVPATVTAYGPSCVGPNGPLVLTADSPPFIGTSYAATCSGATATAVHLGSFGFVATSLPLPTVTPTGQAGCDLLVTPVILAVLPVTGSTVRSGLQLPNDQTLAGLVLRQQVLQLEFTPAGLAVVRSSNGLELGLGAF